MSPSIPGEHKHRDLATWAGVLIAVASSAAIIVARFAALEESRHNLETALAKQQDDFTKIETRVRAMETSRALEVQLNTLTSDIAVIKAQVQELRDDARVKRR